MAMISIHNLMEDYITNTNYHHCKFEHIQKYPCNEITQLKAQTTSCK